MRPRIGRELGRGAEGIVYENLDQPGWVVKEFHRGRVSPLQAGSEFANLQSARAIRPGNVLQVQAPADPRQGWLVKEEYFDCDAPGDVAEFVALALAFGGNPDSAGNLRWGITANNLVPRWILIE